MQVSVHNSKARINIKDNQLFVSQPNSDDKDKIDELVYPLFTVEMLNIYGNAQVTTQALQELVKLGVPIFYYQENGHSKFRVYDQDNVDALTLRKQIHCSDDYDFRLEISKEIISNKLHNQKAVVKKYIEMYKIDLYDVISHIDQHIELVYACKTIDEIKGHEGTSARAYFSGLSNIVPGAFEFNGRSTRPPLDEFNSMISMGYSHLYQWTSVALDKYNLHPSIGFLHNDRQGHRALASDLIEEWRAIIVDDTIIDLIINHKLDDKNEYFTYIGKAVYLNHKGNRLVLKAIGNKMIQKQDYLLMDSYKMDFDSAHDQQIQRLKRSIVNNDPLLFKLENDVWKKNVKN
jgi:CRISPR-associated protein Cas1